MLTRDLQDKITNWTVANSGYERHRPYIGLSGIGDCEQVIYDRFRNGEKIAVAEHFKTRISYELEGRLVERLRAMKIYTPGEEIVLFDGLVQGHTDGIIGGSDLLEIKTVPIERFLPEGKKLPGRVFWQVQAYLHYTRRRYAHVMYLARDTGLVWTTGVTANSDMAAKIEAKLGRLVDAVMTYTRPECSCGRCEAAKS